MHYQIVEYAKSEQKAKHKTKKNYRESWSASVSFNLLLVCLLQELSSLLTT